MFLDERLDILKMSAFQINPQIQCNRNENPNRKFIKLDKLILEFMWKRKCTRTNNKIKEKKKKQEKGPDISVIKTH